MTWEPLVETPPTAQCSRCHRLAWTTDEIGTEDRMVQPDGGPCGGTFAALIQNGADVYQPDTHAIADSDLEEDRG